MYSFQECIELIIINSRHIKNNRLPFTFFLILDIKRSIFVFVEITHLKKQLAYSEYFYSILYRFIL